MSIRYVASGLKTRLAALAARNRDSYRRYLRGESGAIAIYFGLSCLVFIGVAGLAVDAARGYLVKARLSEAIDAAALAGGKALQTAGDPLNNKVKADALAFFNANFPNGAMGANVVTPVINVTNNNTLVTVSSSATIPTTLMSVLGFQQMTMAAAGTVARAQSGLDVVFSFDVSGSMGSPMSKINALKSNATALVDSLYKPFTTGGQTQIVTVAGEDYSLLNIGVVPWSSKVNVFTYPNTTPGTVTGPTGSTYTHPMGGRKYPALVSPFALTSTRPGVYTAANSEVPLLLNPSSGTEVPGGWRGCVYARYWEDGLESTDADTTLGPTAAWPGWEPIPTNEGEDYSSFRDCYAAYWNQNSDASVPGPDLPVPNPGWWVPPFGARPFGSCADCPAVGILPLQTTAATVKTMINSLTPGGATDAPQGLFWAWEVLMPGTPFDEAKVSPPFQRAQAIVFMTDGQNWGSNGDAYHGWFGDGTGAGTTTSKGNITMPDGTSVKNNLDNRLLQLAAKIKGTNPLDPSAVKIYVIQYVEPNEDLKTLLKAVATQPQAPYYYFAPDTASLATVFDQIAASLSALRIVK
ncbi:TadE/TadG family type IV pilus assembly protein [Dongia sp. agr-C8]